MTGYRVTISGLKGGHSGMNINQGRGNANCLMGRTLYSAMEDVYKRQGKSIADVLEMTVEEALEFFRDLPKIGRASCRERV